MTINGEEYVLHKVVPSDLKDIHHIISRKLMDNFRVNDPKNKIEIKRRKHIALNSFFGGEAQAPKEQLGVMLEIWKTALSEEVRQALYDMLSLEDEAFYDYDLVKKHKLLKDKI